MAGRHKLNKIYACAAELSVKYKQPSTPTMGKSEQVKVKPYQGIWGQRPYKAQRAKYTRPNNGHTKPIKRTMKQEGNGCGKAYYRTFFKKIVLKKF
jgi:hypothetical protein